MALGNAERLTDEELAEEIDPLPSFSNPLSSRIFAALVAQQFSKFLHLASAAVSEEVSAVGIPLGIVNPTNPMARPTVFANVEGARFRTLVVAAGVVSHDMQPSNNVGLPKTVTLSQCPVLPHEGKVVFPAPPLRAAGGVGIAC